MKHRPAADKNIIQSTLIACWITKATNTGSEYVILTAFHTATMGARKSLNITLYPHCLSRFFSRAGFLDIPGRVHLILGINLSVK